MGSENIGGGVAVFVANWESVMEAVWATPPSPADSALVAFMTSEVVRGVSASLGAGGFS